MNIRQFFMGRAVGFIVLVIVIGAIAYFYSMQQKPATSDQQLSAEQVVDLEVQAQAEYEAAQAEAGENPYE